MRKPRLYMSKTWMQQQIYRNHKSPTDIAKELGVSPQTIYTWAEKHGIKT